MKKLHVLTVALLVAGAVSSWAQVENDRIVFGPVPITFKGKLSDGSTVTGATLNEGNLEFAAVQLIGPDVSRASHTSEVFHVIGSSIGLSNVVSEAGTNAYLSGTDIWDDTDGIGADDTDVSKSASKPQTFGVFGGAQINMFTGGSDSNGQSVVSNTVLFVVFSESSSTKGTNVSGTVVGVWKEGSTTVKGTISTEKVK